MQKRNIGRFIFITSEPGVSSLILIVKQHPQAIQLKELSSPLPNLPPRRSFHYALLMVCLNLASAKLPAIEISINTP